MKPAGHSAPIIFEVEYSHRQSGKYYRWMASYLSVAQLSYHYNLGATTSIATLGLELFMLPLASEDHETYGLLLQEPCDWAWSPSLKIAVLVWMSPFHISCCNMALLLKLKPLKESSVMCETPPHTMEAPSNEAEIGPETGSNIRSRLWPPYRDITRTLGW